MEFTFSCLPASLTEPAFLAFVSKDAGVNLVDANAAWLELMGISNGEWANRSLDELPVEVAVKRFALQLKHHLRKKDFTLFQEGFETWVGEQRLLVRLTPVCDRSGRVQRVLGIVKDATDTPSVETLLQDMNRKLQVISDCNQALLRAGDEQTLLYDICRTICDGAGYRMAWVGFPEYHQDMALRPVAWAGEEKYDLQETAITWVDEEGSEDPSNLAIRGGRSVAIQDLAADPRATPWREAALAHGFRSSITLPLKDKQQRVFGVLNIYAAREGAFTPDECKLLEQLAGDLAFGINVLRSRLAHKQAEDERQSNLFFFENMDRINRAIQRASNLEQMMSDVLDAMLDIFDCDRAYLLHPCDPDAPTWTVPMERTRPEYPGVLALGLEMETDPELAKKFRVLLDADGPVQFGPGLPHAVPEGLVESFELKSVLAMALYPKLGKPWQFGIHQCSSVRKWNADEQRLLQEIGLRLTDGLTSMLILRDLHESQRKLKEAESQYRTLVENLPDCIARFNREGHAIFVNQAVMKTFGFSSDYVVGEPVAVRGPGSKDENVVLEGMIKRAFDEGEVNSLETKFQTLEGIRDFAIMHVPERDEAGRVVSVLGIAHDITDRKRAEEALRSSEERYRRIVDTASEGIWVVDTNNVTSFVNARMSELLGYRKEEMIGRTMADFLFKQDEAVHREWDAAVRRGDAKSDERRFRRGNGEALWALASASPIYGGDQEFLGSISLFTDITERKRQQEQLLYQAHYDPLTGLPNRFLVMDRLQQNIRLAARNGTSTALLFLDLDDFKKVNDALGHEVGDQVLVLAAIRLKQAVRNSDTVARLGGDEFIVLIHDIPNGEAVRPVAEKIVQAFQEVFQVMGREVMLTASLGVSIYPDDGNDPLVLLRNADTAMYHSKAMGRNAYQYFTESMNLDVAHRLHMEEQLRLALERGELHLVYQPIVDMESGQIVAAEALLRWHNALLGDVPTKEFIDVAEQTGLIIGIGEWVLVTALNQLRRWEEETGKVFRLALNVSPRQFRQVGFVKMLERALSSTGIGGERLELEITEGILLSGEAGAAEVIAQLRELGATISMDDFGTGYSSLSYLKKYNFDTLKIDRVFIRDVIEDPNDRELILATLRMARGLSVKVVAEGVETAEQMDFLRRESCDFAQGFYLSRPLKAQGFEKILNRKIPLG